jgi:hypothetical protein
MERKTHEDGREAHENDCETNCDPARAVGTMRPDMPSLLPIYQIIDLFARGCASDLVD